jgi:type II secretory pathway pseudopilin PulG
MKITKTFSVVAAVIALAWPLASRTQTANDEAAKNAQQAHAKLDAMVKALGGQAWLDMKNQVREGYIAAFYQGKPDTGTTQYWEFHQWPDSDRVELTKHRDVVEFYLGREGWEVMYRGKKPMDKEILDDFLRRRDHSIETAVKVWLKDPNTILVDEGQHQVQRRLADQVTLISAQNESITILMDTESHLPLRRVFQWRDPLYKDKNTDAEEYDNYHVMDGFPTPLSITRFRNDEMYRQYYVKKVSFNQQLPADFWSVDAADKRIRK